MVTSLTVIEDLALEKENENYQFQDFLKASEGTKIDTLVQELNSIVTSQIDCTTCGNCCKTLLINVTKNEADNLSLYLNKTRIDFDKEYVEKGSNGMMLMNTIPCSFLADNKCTIYDYRFAGCREFPGLDIPNFTKRLFTVFMHYGRCPIIFNVVEQLKVMTNFK